MRDSEKKAQKKKPEKKTKTEDTEVIFFFQLIHAKKALKGQCTQKK